MKLKRHLPFRLFLCLLVLISAIQSRDLRAALTCTPKAPFVAVVAGNGTYIENMCTETGNEAACLAARAVPSDFKNAEPHQHLYNGFENGIARRYGYNEIAKLVKDLGDYFDTGSALSPTPVADKILNDDDCPPFQVALVGYSNGAYTAAMAVGLMFQKNMLGGGGLFSHNVSIANFKKDFKIRLGLIDPIKIGIVQHYGGADGITLPEDNACIFHIYQENGCPVKYCKLSLGAIPIPPPLNTLITNPIFKGMPYKGLYGTYKSIDFSRDMTGATVQTKIDNATAQSQPTNHLNMEVIGGQLATHVFSPSGDFLNCGTPSFMNNGSGNPGDAHQTGNTDPVGDMNAIITGIATNTKTLASITDDLGTDRVSLALGNIVHFRSLSIAAHNAMQLYPSNTLAVELKNRMDVFATLDERLVGPQKIQSSVTASSDPAVDVQLLFSTNSKYATYITPQDLNHDLVTNPTVFEIPQMVTEVSPAQYTLKNETIRRFYRAEVNDLLAEDNLYATNIKLLRNLSTPSTITTWGDTLSVFVPSTFTRTTLPNSVETYYPWSLDSANVDGEQLEASGLALDFTQGQAKVSLSGVNVKVLRQTSPGVWTLFQQKDPSTGHSLTIVKSTAELEALMQNIGFQIIDENETSTLTVGLQFFVNGAAGDEVQKIISLPAPDAIDPEVIGTLDSQSPDFNNLIPNKLWGVGT